MKEEDQYEYKGTLAIIYSEDPYKIFTDNTGNYP
jgi:hypothetical protein